ncbi:MAG: hypothetical protein WC003_14175 [Terrimicrobiaceae bacterium]
MNTSLPSPAIHYSPHPVLVPQPGVEWADTMVLNPTVIDEPGTRRLHMLFRASGPWPQARIPGKPLPYPIFLGYAHSDDGGRSWEADFSRPCLAPRLATAPEALRIAGRSGNSVVNHANGCIEDPRLFRLDGKCYVTTACRLFPAGPYWEKDSPMQCAPDWAAEDAHALGRAARENLTVSVLFEVRLDALSAGQYDDAFRYVAHLTDPARGDNRDVVLFPEKLRIEGRERYVALHRPKESDGYCEAGLPPSIFAAASDSLEEFPAPSTRHRLVAAPLFEWEGDRIGASWTPIRLGEDEWLLPCHGKQDAKVGYTQSFMILKTDGDGWPCVAHRCPVRLMFARQKWELKGRFPTPCLFTCGGVVLDGELIMTYGAADTVCGLAWANFDELVRIVRQFDENGNTYE